MENPSHRNKNTPDDKSPQKDSGSLAETYRKLAPYLNIGYVWAISVIAFTLLGVYLDNRWQTKPWLTLAGALLGIFSGFYHLIKTVIQEDKKENGS